MPIKVFLTEPIQAEAQALLAKNVELDIGHDNLSTDEVLGRVAEVDVIFSKTDPIRIDQVVIDAAPNLMLIARHGSGYSNVAMEYATEKGIFVTNTPGVNAITMAEYTIGIMFAAARNIVPAANACHGGAPNRLSFLGQELYGKTFGIVGVGQIGRQVVMRADALGMKVLAYHPRPSARNLTDLPLDLVDLDQLLDESDVISLHMPYSDETRNLIGAPELRRMKKSAILLNLSRGGVVDEKALYKSLKNESIFAAATDVLANEPVHADEPLLQLKNCLVLPHIAAVTREAQKSVAMTAVEDILRFSRGELLHHLVNLTELENR
jgi:D-3-phosphoglycerate dehydrogenase